ncbi:iron ABC transporter permease [Alphaproteobacteria bacterium]|nr:iron ABC transporter permease [Alphaproteobacteria bacterium]
MYFNKNYNILNLSLLIILFLSFFLSLSVNNINSSLEFFAEGVFYNSDLSKEIIFYDIKLPRTILGVLTGATLGLCGAAIQGLFRNPLAEPGIIGVSSTASLGSVIVLYFGLTGAYSFLLPFGGLVGAFIAVITIFILAGKNSSTLTLILSGVAINAFAASMTSLFLNLAPSPYAALEIIFWILGSIADRDFGDILIALPLIFGGWILLLGVGKGLDALTLGEDIAKSLGINTKLLKIKIILSTALSVGATVSITGGISFVGLIVPHLIRPLVKYEPSKILFPSAIGGAIIVLLSDILVRLIPTNIELKLGVITAIIGAPFFLYLILYNKRNLH